MKLVEGGVPIKFLSTPSARRATWSGPWRRPSHRHFYPHPPRGGRPHISREEVRPFRISIHALREEGDRPDRCRQERLDISIHALREEGDRRWGLAGGVRKHFYPRPPRGGRPGLSFRLVTNPLFLSTPSVRRATGQHVRRRGQGQGISIHALHEEGDQNHLCRPRLV